MITDRDAIIIGAGPSGLALACALADAGLTVALLERLPLDVLADPPEDGRDIALTHRSEQVLRSLGIWQQLPAQEIAPIRTARVQDGNSPYCLDIHATGSGSTGLGYLVPNHRIRAAAFAVASACPAVEILSQAHIAAVASLHSHVEVRLAKGTTLTSRLLIAADSRFSETRRQMGIGADMRDFGRVVIVCRMAHEREHDGIAHECFHYGRTLAVLPLNGRLASIVITVPADQATALLHMPAQRFASVVRDQFQGRLGDMRLAGERHAYPLVAVYAHSFVARRFALIGDAAVGMHPVTAHGFNFGLYGVDALTRAISAARRSGGDIGGMDALAHYQAEHRRVTRPIYLGTNALVGLYTDDTLPARLLRSAVLRVANHLPPLKAGIVRQLSGTRGDVSGSRTMGQTR